MSAVKKLVTKEKLFQVMWVNNGNKPGRIAFASPFESTIEEVEISPNYSLIAQRGAWLASDPTVKLDVAMNLGLSGFLGGRELSFRSSRDTAEYLSPQAEILRRLIWAEMKV